MEEEEGAESRGGGGGGGGKPGTMRRNGLGGGERSAAAAQEDEDDAAPADDDDYEGERERGRRIWRKGTRREAGEEDEREQGVGRAEGRGMRRGAAPVEAARAVPSMFHSTFQTGVPVGSTAS